MQQIAAVTERTIIESGTVAVLRHDQFDISVGPIDDDDGRAVSRRPSPLSFHAWE